MSISCSPSRTLKTYINTFSITIFPDYGAFKVIEAKMSAGLNFKEITSRIYRVTTKECYVVDFNDLFTDVPSLKVGIMGT